MKGIASYWRKTGRLLLAAFAMGCVLYSCDSAIYDDEGDCSVTYRVVFRYDKNMKGADAFSSEVSSVRLYAFDREGVLVWQRAAKGEVLKADGNSMTLDLPAGDYRLLAWCGLDNDGETSASFTVPEARIGETRIEELQCCLSRAYDAAGAYSDRKLAPLYHGMTEVSLPVNDDGGSYDFPLELTKNTNHVRIILQHLSGEPVDVRDFTFRIEEENGLMGYDNSLQPDEMIAYRPYHTGSGTAGMGIDDYPEVGGMSVASREPQAITSVSVAIADLTVARLVEDRLTWLTIETPETKSDGTVEMKTSARIPLTSYALLLMDGYDREFASKQDYLDCQDEYALVLFLDPDRVWIRTSIIINSWKYVFNKVDL